MNTIQGFLLNVFSACGLTVAIGLGCLAMAPLVTLGATQTWTGGGNANNSGSWETNSNWSTTKPASGDTGSLINVTAGIRVVSNETAETITQLVMVQTSSSATNKLLLGGALNVLGATPLSLSSPAGTNNLVLDLNGNSLVVSNTASYYPTLSGTVNMGPGSYFNMMQGSSGGNGNMVFSNTGYLAQNNSTVNYQILGGNQSGNTRRFVNTGTWILTNNSAFNYNSAFGWGTPANSGTLIIRDSSTLNVGTMNNTGYLELGGTNAIIGSNPTLNNSGTFNVICPNATVGNGNGIPTLLNSGTMNLGSNGIPCAVLFDGQSAVFSNAATMNIVTGSTITLQFRPGNGTVCQFYNTATAAMDNVTLDYNLVTGNLNNNYNSFNNSGLWTLTNGSRVIGTGWNMNSSGIHGFNSGTVRVRSGSTLGFLDLAQTGTLELGTNVTVGGRGNLILNNTGSGTVTVTGANALFGDTGENSDSDGNPTFNNGSASSQGARLTVGDGVISSGFVIQGVNSYLNNYFGNTVTVSQASTLRLTANVYPGIGRNRAASIYNTGTVFHVGTVQLQPEGSGTTGINNYGTYMVGQGNVATATIQRLAQSQSAFPATPFYNNVGATLAGAGVLIHVNSTGNSTADFLGLANVGTIAPTTGGALTIQNVIIQNTGTINPNNSSLILANASLTNSAIVSIQNGGLLEANTFVQLAGGTMTNWGGANQFSVANPTVSRTTADTIVLTNGTISFRAITNADVYANGNGTVGNQLTNILYQGTNAFRLDAASNTLAKTQTYTFASNLGPTNYARLELLNGAMYRNGNVTIGTNGTLLVSNGVSTVSGTLTFDPTATLSVDLSKTSGYGALIAQSNVDLGGCALNINLGSAPVVGSSFMIISNSAGYTTNSFGTSRQVLTVNNTNYVVRISTATNGVSLNCSLQTRGFRLIIE